jgi:hypothetical protein
MGVGGLSMSRLLDAAAGDIEQATHQRTHLRG